MVEPTLTIGDFSRATHLSVKMLRHYHDIGLLEPADVDPDTGYRRYGTAQIATAQVIRRFRDLDMPLEEIHAVLSAPDPETRSRLISAHLARLEASLARTQEAVATLRDLLDARRPQRRSGTATPPPSRRRRSREVVDRADALAWYQGALGELHATLAAQGITATARRAASTRPSCSPTSAARRRSSSPARRPAAHGPGHRRSTSPQPSWPPSSTPARMPASTWPTARSPPT